jgi:hypothetical protein
MTAQVAAWLPCIACGSVIKYERVARPAGAVVTLGHVGPPDEACRWLGEALATGDVVLEPLVDADLRRRLARPH